MSVTVTFNCAHCGTSRFAEIDAQIPNMDGATWIVREATRGAPPLARLQLTGALALAACPSCGQKHYSRLISPLVPWLAMLLPAAAYVVLGRVLDWSVLTLGGVGLLVVFLSLRRWKEQARSIQFHRETGMPPY